jgi:hypothetical protein
MGYVVTRAGMTDYEFWQCHINLSRWQFDLARSPRALDPHSRDRWLYVWQDKSQAEEFIGELKNWPGSEGWEVAEAEAAGVGPLGPFMIYHARRGRDFTIALEHIFRRVIRSLYPDAVQAMSGAEMQEDDWQEFRRRQGGLAEMFHLVAPLLTGISHERLAALGYFLLDDKTWKAVLRVPPADVTQAVSSAPAVPSLAG